MSASERFLVYLGLHLALRGASHGFTAAGGRDVSSVLAFLVSMGFLVAAVVTLWRSRHARK
jgi:hypothetical protein